ncbi:MAG: hypothetical protein K2I66_02510 [Bacteroidales bacterium]|nr:hypothetical protein [Bacteroidales bacterium]
MKKSFVFGLIVITLAVGLCSCNRCKIITWRGDKEIPAEGGTVVWKPVIDDVRLTPVIRAASFGFHDSNDDWVSTQLDIDSLIIKKESYEKLVGEWYEVVASINAVSITLSPNDTSFKRVIQVTIDDGQHTGFHTMCVSQSPKSWYQESE